MPTPLPGGPNDEIRMLPNQLSDLAENYRLSNVRAGYRDLVEQELSRLGRILEDRVKANTPRVSGRLARSTRFRIIRTVENETDVTYELQIIQDALANPRASVRNRYFYWYTVHHGLRPAGRLKRTYPPPINLQNWVMRAKGESIQDAPGVARKIAWNIFKEGIEPNTYLFDSLEQEQTEIQVTADKIAQDLAFNLNHLPEIQRFSGFEDIID